MQKFLNTPLKVIEQSFHPTGRIINNINTPKDGSLLTKVGLPCVNFVEEMLAMATDVQHHNRNQY